MAAVAVDIRAPADDAGMMLLSVLLRLSAEAVLRRPRIVVPEAEARMRSDGCVCDRAALTVAVDVPVLPVAMFPSDWREPVVPVARVTELLLPVREASVDAASADGAVFDGVLFCLSERLAVLRDAAEVRDAALAAACSLLPGSPDDDAAIAGLEAEPEIGLLDELSADLDTVMLDFDAVLPLTGLLPDGLPGTWAVPAPPVPLPSAALPRSDMCSS